MDSVFFRNHALFFIVLAFFTGMFLYILTSGERLIDKIDNQVTHTHSVITQAEKLSTLIESMLAAQRGYIITQNEDFLNEYKLHRDGVSEAIAQLNELTADNKSQLSRIDEIRNHFNDFSTKLEERAQRFALEESKKSKVGLQGVESIDNLKDNIVRIVKAILEEEYGLLNKRIKSLDAQKSKYFMTIIIGIIAAVVIFFIYNGFLLHSMRKRQKVEISLKNTEERFALAVDGAQDGIFDWDIQNDSVFYSRRFFEMLGYEKKALVSNTQDFKNLLHPEDVDRVWTYITLYLKGEFPEYKQEFRMKQKSGKWMWIQARAKAIFNETGKPIRMIGAHTDISHLKKAQEKLEAEKKQAIEENRAKSEFLAHMSHEIRTPLTAISGIAEIFKKNQNNLNEKQQKLIKTLASSTSSLKYLVNDILDFSKIESGELELDNSSFRLDELFEETISMMSVRASEKGISFVFDYNEIKEVEYYGDSKRIRQILVNLIGNAVKFTDKGGVSINGTFEERGDETFLRIDVSDSGIGIAPENFDLIFERFKQADSSVSRKYGGTGLGLPISKNLVQLMGGTIFLSSEYGKGSTFTVLLPVHNAFKKSDKTTSKDIILKINDQIRSSLSQNTKALVAEDYEGNIVLLSYMLDEIGLAFDIAKTGREAIDLWEKTHYDLILMDIQMPEMDGFEATAELRKREKLKGLVPVPIIGMTAHALIGDKDKCIEAGMSSYLPKPLVEADLKKEILKYLDDHKQAA